MRWPNLIALLLATAMASALDAQTSSYAEARRLLLDGDYASAAAMAQSVSERAPSQATYRLLALARSRLGQPAEAVWALRCATALGAPTEQAMIVEEVYASLPPDLRPLPHRGISAVAGGITRSPVPQLPSLLVLVAAVVACGLLVTWLVAPARLSRQRLIVALIISAAVAAVATPLAFRQNTLARPSEAVVLAEAPLQEAPAEAAPGLRMLPAGAVVKTGERLADFLAVELPSGEAGWVAEEALRAVAPLD